MKPLHLRLSALAQELRERGEEDLCQWIQRHIAAEQQAARKPHGEAKKKVRMKASGAVIWVPARMTKESEDGEVT